jgi:acetate kinase
VKVLVINSGSSSLKYQLIDVERHEVLRSGLCEKVGFFGSFIRYDTPAGEKTIEMPMPNHQEAIRLALESLDNPEDGVIASLDEVDAVGHRIVHGGEYFSEVAYVDESVIEKIEELIELAPLHNPAALMGIEACGILMPDKPQGAVFDTAFHQSMPAKNYIYPILIDFYKEQKIRKYGAHGTSHRYVSQRAIEMLGGDTSARIITCHLGNGGSITAIKDGKSYDTSMGFTPLDGVMMGSRCGSIDPAIVTFIMDHEGLSSDEMNNLMNRRSGLLGVTGISNDLREIDNAAQEGSEVARLAIDMYAQSIRKYIGQYIVELNGVDGIVMTAGIGENSAMMREHIFAELDNLGIKLDSEKNAVRSREARFINAEDSAVKIMVIPTQEEYMIAYDIKRMCEEHGLAQ